MAKTGPKGPQKYTEQRIRILEECFKNGLPVRFSCAQAGIGTDTHYDWLRKYPEYAERIEKARADNVKTDLEFIRSAGIGIAKTECPNCGVTVHFKLPTKSWTALAWRLERLFPEEFSLIQQHRHSLDKPVEINIKFDSGNFPDFDEDDFGDEK